MIYNVTVAAVTVVLVVSVAVAGVATPREITTAASVTKHLEYVNSESGTQTTQVMKKIDVNIVTQLNDNAGLEGSYDESPYPLALVRAFGVSLALSTIGIIGGVLYLLVHTHTAAFVGSLSFAAGSFGIAGTLLKGEQLLRSRP